MKALSSELVIMSQEAQTSNKDNKPDVDTQRTPSKLEKGNVLSSYLGKKKSQTEDFAIEW